MAWIIAITLLIFYALGVWVFHATAVRVLPLVAVAVLVIDRLLIWKYGARGKRSSQG
jgi:hypothetical protein